NFVFVKNPEELKAGKEPSNMSKKKNRKCEFANEVADETSVRSETAAQKEYARQKHIARA
ncbi:hypothetical protein RUM43_002088, partial [Polyplax serrata]